ncbi:MAG: hypothetical protein M2R46_04437 [Verrucomicrobia subdivision 3 bacterium]|nr:hypothetical protein [Limisphaerales bacterium]
MTSRAAESFRDQYWIARKLIVVELCKKPDPTFQLFLHITFTHRFRLEFRGDKKCKATLLYYNYVVASFTLNVS